MFRKSASLTFLILSFFPVMIKKISIWNLIPSYDTFESTFNLGKHSKINFQTEFRLVPDSSIHNLIFFPFSNGKYNQSENSKYNLIFFPFSNGKYNQSENGKHNLIFFPFSNGKYNQSEKR